MPRVRVDNPEKRITRTLDWFVERVKTWQDRLGLSGWTLHVALYERPPADSEGNTKTFASVTEADITFKANQYEAWEDKVVIHELMHVMTDEWAKSVEQVVRTMVPTKLQKEARALMLPHEEQVVDNIAKAFQRLAEGLPK